MYLVELGSGSSARKPKEESLQAPISVDVLARVVRYRPVRSLEEIEDDANSGDQSGLDIVLGNYRNETHSSFDVAAIFDFLSYAVERVKSYLKPKRPLGPPETWHD